MPVQLVLQLLATYGPTAVDLIDKLISKWEANGPVTPEEWAALSPLLKKSAKDHMLARLQAAGIDPASDQGKALLGLAA